jgi:GT2 family glycosyltransferase
MNLPKVSIVVVTWNSEKDISVCLQSCLDQNYENIDEVIVVDNNSSDKTIEIVKNNFSKIHIIQSAKNTYFTGGNNLGIKRAIERNCDYVCLINADAKADKSWIKSMIDAALSNKKVGIVGPKLIFWENENTGLLNSTGLIYDGFMHAYDRGFLEEDKGQYNQLQPVAAVTGCGPLLSVQMLNEVGLFWEKLRMYLEDVELAIRAKKNNWEIIYQPEAIIYHKYMQSTNQNKLLRIEEWKMKNWMLIALRHYKFKSKVAMILKYLKFKIFKS